MTSSTAHDIWNYQRRPLDAIFRPKSVAVIGASAQPGSVGRTIVENLIDSPFSGEIFLVNPKRNEILGQPAYSNIKDISASIDLAVIVVPAKIVPIVAQECVDAGVRGAIVISAGFKEIGESGAALEAEVLKIARSGNMRIVGPNCLGVMIPHLAMNATFASKMASPGSVGFISQSGAMLTSILDWSFRENVGFSAFVSIGSMLDVDWGDIITYLGDDRKTKSIVIYMESIGNARSFLSAAREVALTKPIIVIKPGRTEAAAQAAASHTGSMTGSDEVLDAAFKRAGVLRVDRISDLFNIAELLSKQPVPKGPNLMIITNAGGPGVLSTDALIGSRGELAPLTSSIEGALDKILPAHWSHANPIDILGDATPEIYRKTVEVVREDQQTDGLLVVLSPQAMTDPTRTAENLVRSVDEKRLRKPLIASWMGGADVSAGVSILNRAGIPTFDYPDTAARMFSYMWQFAKNLNSLYETPRWNAEAHPDRPQVEELTARVRQTGRTILTEWESKQVMAAYGIPTVRTELASSEEEAVALAAQIGYPVVLKLNSETITHKTDVGGVQLNLGDEEAVRNAYQLIENKVSELYTTADFLGVTVQPMLDLSDGYELILGSSPDPQFGSVLLFGTGGTLVEVFHDSALALPPLNSNLARRMMQRTKIYKALKGIRGRDSVDIEALEGLMVNFSFLVSDQKWIKEIDINPLLASADQLIALDARVILHEPEVKENDLVTNAIRPYPSQYETMWETKGGMQVEIRPIRPDDEPRIIEFHKKLSPESVYMRYFTALQFNTRVAHSRLIRVCHVDYDRDMAIVIVKPGETEADDQIIGVGRLTKEHGQNVAEYAILIADDYHGQGLGTKMLNQLIQIGRDEKVDQIIAYMLPENSGMVRVSKKLGFKMRLDDGAY
ncbi:MAG: bifunctional acetate--CoA ligase family protein/GNAT family N-acetyltransferase, partial [Chloroflexota bacterium]